ncbi:MAG: hypothetical protein V7K53_14655 [Nostoc sp.]|uniref:hypothetical protein n=1 Tax=Nostoc sp. TaxID=1180 RepID=UPI002FF9D575
MQGYHLVEFCLGEERLQKSFRNCNAATNPEAEAVFNKLRLLISIIVSYKHQQE